MKQQSLLLALLFLLCACTNKTTTFNRQPTDNIKYAQGFEFANYDNFRELTIFEPFREGILARYYLVTDAQTPTPEDGTKIVVPIQRIGIASNTHIGFLDALGLLDNLKGVCLSNTIYNQTVVERCNAGEITDMGDAMQIDPERAMLAGVNAITISGYGQGDVNPERLKSVGINSIYNNEWTEHTPLGRAEWIKVYGALFCIDQLADSLFDEIEAKYIAAKEAVGNIPTDQRLSIMSGNNFRGTWYMSSGDSYMGQLFADAGAEYYFENDSTQGSIPMSIETVIEHFNDADIWVGSNGHSLDELASYDPKHTWFKAFKTGRVYNFYHRLSPTGANDYWERGVVHPEELLTDLIWALYPEKMTDYQPIYIEQLK